MRAKVGERIIVSGRQKAAKLMREGAMTKLAQVFVFPSRLTMLPFFRPRQAPFFHLRAPSRSSWGCDNPGVECAGDDWRTEASPSSRLLLPTRAEPHSMEPLDLHGPEQRFGDSIVAAIALAAHRAQHREGLQLLLEIITGVLTAADGMEDQPVCRTPPKQAVRRA